MASPANMVRLSGGSFVMDWPLCQALKTNAPPFSVATLISADMPVSRRDGRVKQRHNYTWVYAVADQRCAAAIYKLLQPNTEGGFGYGAYADVLARSRGPMPAQKRVLRRAQTSFTIGLASR